MIIVAGRLLVEPEERDAYLAGCLPVIELARQREGCVAFHLSADPIEAGVVNVFEQWRSAEALDRFRGSGTSEGEQAGSILDAEVYQHEIATSTRL